MAIQIGFKVPDKAAPALRSAVEEMSHMLGTRLESPHRYDKEEALTMAALGLGKLRQAVNALVPAGDPNYE